jgi:hypothetical protein
VDYAQLRADRQIVEQAARRIRDRAIRDGYLGLEHKHVSFALALILDEVTRHLRDLDDELRVRVVDSCRGMLRQA